MSMIYLHDTDEVNRREITIALEGDSLVYWFPDSERILLGYW